MADGFMGFPTREERCRYLRDELKVSNFSIIVLDASDSSADLMEQFLFWLNFVNSEGRERSVFIVADKFDQICSSNVESMSKVEEICNCNGYLFSNFFAEDAKNVDELLSQIAKRMKAFEKPAYYTPNGLVLGKGDVIVDRPLEE